MAHAKILVIEDDEDCRRILVLRLQHLGAFTIREATSGQDALDCITRDPPDLIFLDLKLPGVDGLETARRIRALPGALSQLPIIAVTAYVLTWDKDKALTAGCDEYITKPIVDPGEIREKLERLLAHGRRHP
jgi:two-component system cell cycle response regulator DivK